jgi:alcohol dehydrogenase (NADP+)
MTTFLLNSGFAIPAIGLGTYNAVKEGEVKTAVTAAIKAGYKHIDCASLYQNEKEVDVR